MFVTRYPAFMALILALFVGCSTPQPATNADPRQQAIDATYTSYRSLSAAINAADAAVVAGQLKGQDARNALQAFTVAKTGLDAALVSLRASAPASSGVSR